MAKLAPSILTADFSKLAENVAAIQQAGAHLIHLDVMDGHFVPNISFGAPVVRSLRGKTSLPFDVHLMIEHPDLYIPDFVTELTEYIVVHQEACPHLHRTIQHIKSFGIKAGVAINPATSPSVLDYVMDDLDLVLIMSVNPGFGGQRFIPQAINKVLYMNEIRHSTGLDFEIEVDGGITLENAGELLRAGADIIVAGSAVFHANRIEENTRSFLDILNAKV